MEQAEIKKAYALAVTAAAAMTAAPLIYGVVVKVLMHTGYRPPLSGEAATTAAYVLYAAAVTPLAALKALSGRLGAKGAGASEKARALTAAVIVRGAVFEAPAVAGLALFLMTGGHREFFALMLVSIVLMIFNFPRLSEWEEKLGPSAGRME